MTGPRHAMIRSTAPEFRILTVCTGNICRSPQAELLLRQRLPSAFPGWDPAVIEVTSAGTMALDGHRMEPLAVAEAGRLGLHGADGHRARRLQPALVERADLVLALAREHRSAAVASAPTAHRRAFTLVEFACLAERVAAGHRGAQVRPLGEDGIPAFLSRVVAACADRSMIDHAQRADLDIEDPYRRSAAVYRRSADAVARQVDRLVVALASLARANAA
ncbi:MULTISPECIES: low molecular weight phosphatase family protein [unclassified Agrococcus]|uniref:arsenate reductase/protein-tyrosine-phosphatase family protein n=1 Tax=unclassified Agrococcus TaxID=2615065 RepID=UPI00248544F2|nr:MULTISPECIES: low molecular weight phosphatase family protein [unclassified Agrococcus]MDR7233176.1 protein-tyrosine phosphatase [Agrococcus sp. BE272]